MKRLLVGLGSSLFFFSSRRRHTRSYGDWSSDVCSSDLNEFCVLQPEFPELLARRRPYRLEQATAQGRVETGRLRPPDQVTLHILDDPRKCRSEERRVGKGCSGWWGG